MNINLKAFFFLAANLVQQRYLQSILQKCRYFIPLFTVILLITLLNNRSYSADKNIDVVLLMDSSGSMKYTDPKTMRIPAARMFVSLLGDKDRVSIVTFGTKAIQLTPLIYVKKDDEQNILIKAIDSISSSEKYTNLYTAVAKGLQILSENRRDKKNAGFIIIMSDGKMDVGNATEDLILVKRLRNEMIGRLKDNRIRLFSLAFTEQSDKKLLKTLSKKTGGRFSYTSTDKDLHLIYASIFEDLKEPDMLPLQNNKFNIDTTIDEVTIIATKDSPDTKIKIRSPNRINYFSDYNDDYITWFTSSNFDMVTIKAPDQGVWEILFSSGQNNKAYLVTDLKLASDFDKISLLIGETFSLRIWLERDGKPIERGAILHDVKTSIELQEPDGSKQKIALDSGLDKSKTPYGFQSNIIKPDQPGNYKINVIVKSKTFERQKKYSFSVVDKEEDKIEFTAITDADDISEEKTIKKPTVVNKKNLPEPSLLKTFIIFLLINLILVGIVMIYFFIIKKQPSKKSVAKIPSEKKKNGLLKNIIKTFFNKKDKPVDGDK